MAHVGSYLRESIYILNIVFTKLDRAGRIHAKMSLIHRIKLLRNNFHLTTWLHLLVELTDGSFSHVDLLYELRLVLLAITC